MKFTDIVTDLIHQKGITKSKMLKDLHMGTGTFATWEARGTIPNGETLSKIASYFNVTTDYLLGNEQNNKPATDRDKLTSEILELFEQLPAKSKQELLDFARYKVDSQSKK